MTIRVEWDAQDATRVLWTVEGAWTWEQFYAAFEQSKALVMSVSYRVDVITDMRRAGPVPLSPASLHIRQAMGKTSPNLGIIVLVGLDAFAHALLSVIQRVVPKAGEKMRTVRTLEEAEALIAQARGTTIPAS